MTLIAEPKGIILVRTKPDGTFRFRGARAGPVTLLATDLRTGETSQSVSVLLAEGAANEVELRIESGRMLTGVVTSGGVPVAGAVVSAYPLVEGWSSQVRAISDASGRFELQLPASTRRALVAIRAAGRVLQSFDVAVGDKSAVLDLSTAGGTVRLLLPPAPSPFVLRRDGVAVPSVDLFQWADEQGQRDSDTRSMTIRSLAPGMYQACLPSSSRCAQHVLTPNSTVDLNLR